MNSMPRSNVTVCRRLDDSGSSAEPMRSATPDGRRSGLGSKMTKRLVRSSSVVTFAPLPDCTNISRPASQWPKLLLAETSAGRHSTRRPCGIR